MDTTFTLKKKEIIQEYIQYTLGAQKCDLVLENASYVNVFTRKLLKADIAIHGKTIVGVGNYKGKGINTIDMKNCVVVPGMIDSHVHIESSMLPPPEFAKLVVPHGTTTVIADPHEITNVKGLEAIDWILKSTDCIPLNAYIMLPSCVPATNNENSGAILEAEDLEKRIDEERVLGLGELMNYPGILNGEDSVIKKIEMCKKHNKIIDGHAPLVTGNDVNTLALCGIQTDHECGTIQEMMDRIYAGMYVLIREGSACKDLENLCKGVDEFTYRRCLFCTDDRHADDLLEEGSIDNNVRKAIKNNIDPIMAITMATLNAAECYGLKTLGAIAPGYDADLVIVDNLENFQVKQVYKNGKLVAENNKMLPFAVGEIPPIGNSVKIKPVTKDHLKIPITSTKVAALVISPGTIETKKEVVTINPCTEFVAKDQPGLLKMAVIERHNATGNVGKGIVKGYGLKNGAIAQTIAHDSHNLIVIGDNDEDMLLAIEEINKVQGGITVVSQGRIETLPLEIGGLMSTKSATELIEKEKVLLKFAYDLGVNAGISPFVTLGFMALPVIPEVRITDLGFFNVKKFDFEDINMVE